MMELCNGVFGCSSAPMWFYLFAIGAVGAPMGWLFWDAWRVGYSPRVRQGSAPIDSDDT